MDRYDDSRRWFAFAVPALMAVLLYLVPVLRGATAILFVLSLVPLLFVNSLKDSERALYLYIAWCWMDGTIRGLFGSSPFMAAARDIVLALIISGWIVQRLRTRFDDPLRMPPATGALALFAVLCVLQMANPYALSLMNSLGALKTHLSTIALYFFAFDVYRRRGQVYSLVIFIVLATAVIGSISMLQYVMGEGWTFEHFPGSDKILDTQYNFVSGTDAAGMNLFKPPGTVFYGGATGVFLGIVMPLLCSLILMPRISKKVKMLPVLYSFMAFGYVVGIFCNGLRIAITQAATGLVILAFTSGPKMRAKAFTTVGVAAGLAILAFSMSVALSGGALTKRFGSFFNDPVQAMHQDRVTLFEQFVDLSVHSPFGVGLGRNGPAAQFTPRELRDEKLGFGSYSEAYLGFLILEVGLPGAILIFWAACVFLRQGTLAVLATTDENDRLVGAGILAVEGTMVINMFAGPILVQPPGAVLYWVFAAILIRAYGKNSQPADPIDQPQLQMGYEA